MQGAGEAGGPEEIQQRSGGSWERESTNENAGPSDGPLDNHLDAVECCICYEPIAKNEAFFKLFNASTEKLTASNTVDGGHQLQESDFVEVNDGGILCFACLYRQLTLRPPVNASHGPLRYIASLGFIRGMVYISTELVTVHQIFLLAGKSGQLTFKQDF